MKRIKLKSETQKLRTKSPFRDHKMKMVILVAVLVAIAISCVYANEYSRLPAGPEPVLYFAGAFVLMQAVLFCVGYWLLKRNRRLIDEGVVLYARFVSKQRLPKGIYRVNLEYEFQDQVLEKGINGPRSVALKLESLGRVLVVVDPKSPKRLEYLYQFASTKAERKRVFEGTSGLDA